MKAKKEHRVPLSDQAVALLRTARDRWPNARLMFPGRYGKPLSDMAMLMCMRRLKINATPHGLRSSFRDWCADNGKDDGLAEAALAHAIGSKTERAYKRTDHFEARRALMQAWADFATGTPATNEPASDARPTEHAGARSQSFAQLDSRQALSKKIHSVPSQLLRKQILSVDSEGWDVSVLYPIAGLILRRNAKSGVSSMPWPAEIDD
jgi:hypothetical protein